MIISRASVDNKVEYPKVVTIVHNGNGSSNLAMKISKIFESHVETVREIDINKTQVEELGVCIIVAELDGSILQNPTQQIFSTLKSYVLLAKGVLWITRGAIGNTNHPESGLVQGLARTVRMEAGDKMFISLDLDDIKPIEQTNIANLVHKVFKQTFLSPKRNILDIDVEYREKNGLLMIPRIAEDHELSKFTAVRSDPTTVEDQPFYQPNRPLRLEIGTPGLLDTLRFVDDTKMSHKIPENYIEIEVKASGVNFRDVMMAMGQIEVEGLGGECCGIISAVGNKVTKLKVGDRVASFADDSFANYVRWPENGVEKIPDDMPFEIGATLPIIFCTAYHSIKVSNLSKGETVLIHAASGGLGQALIMLCQKVGAEIYATVGTPEKREFLRSQYGIQDDHMFSSRDGSFAKHLMRVTERRGVDVIFNSISGDMLRRTFECISSFGRFIELGKKDFAVNTRLEMASFAKNVTFTAVDLVGLMAEKPEYASRIWSEVMAMIRRGEINPPQPITTFATPEIEKALRTMQSGKHIGKLVILPQPNDIVKVCMILMRYVSRLETYTQKSGLTTKSG